MSDALLAPDAQTMTVGTSLREARVAIGWTVPEVAKKLNLTVNAVEALEHDQIERLPGIIFARGYIRSYAKILGLDADQLAKDLDLQVGSSSETQHMVQTIDHVGEARRVSRGMLQFSLFVLFLIAVGAAYYAWQVFNSTETDKSAASTVFDRVEVERADGSVHVQTLDELEDQAVAFMLDSNGSDDVEESEVAQQASEIDNDESAKVVAEEAPIQVLLAENQQNSQQATELATQQTEAEKAAPSMGVAQLSFRNDCWLSILDADGKEISSGLKRAGEQLNVTGKAPLDVHLGYAEGVSILYNGEPVDFSSTIRGATARVKLGQ